MRHTTTVTVPFEAGHQLADIPGCRWAAHGHRWTLAVTVAGGLDPTKVYLVDYYDLQRAIHGVVDELSGRNLDDMLPGVRTTPEGIALYVHERLALQWPHISAIEVGMGDVTRVRVEWDLR